MNMPRCLLLGFFLVLSCNSIRGKDPDVDYDAIKLITSKGYPAEAHEVQTSDGYILGMQRIPPEGYPNGTRPVVFLQHGLLCSSTNWLTNLKTQSFAYLLADKGFDVWLGNVRGNTYSKKHVTLTTNDDKFWDFSVDEHALVDLPAMLDYVLTYTKAQKLYYVGHSQGTFMGFAGFSSNQNLASRIAKFYALAPVTTVGHVKGMFLYLAEFYDHFNEIKYLLDVVGHGEFLPSQGLVGSLGELFCNTGLKGVCGDVLFLICGFDEKNLNDSRIPVYLGHTPAGTSVQNIAHWSQLVQSGKFCMYAADKKTDPPCYNVSQLRVPLKLFTGTKDWLADTQDVKILTDKLTKAKVPYTIHNLPDYEHLDFIWGINANKDVYDVIIDDIINAEQKLQN